MNEKAEEKIRKENKKALPLFIGFLVVCFVVGGVTGYMAGSADGGTIKALTQTLRRGLQEILVFVLPSLCVLLMLVSGIVMKKARSLWKTWDGEEESLPEILDLRLNKLLLMQNLTMILAFLTFTLSCLYEEDFLRSAITLLSFSLYLFLLVWQQKRVVDFTKVMNPEKRGSIYDMKFHSKWRDSCDEAERRLMGEAATSTFMTMNVVFPVVWCILALMQDLFAFGPMPAVTVLVLWGICLTIYQVNIIKLSKHK